MILVVMGALDICPIPDTLPPKEDIVGLMVQYMQVDLKISTNLSYSMLYKVLMMLG